MCVVFVAVAWLCVMFCCCCLVVCDVLLLFFWGGGCWECWIGSCCCGEVVCGEVVCGVCKGTKVILLSYNST